MNPDSTELDTRDSVIYKVTLETHTDVTEAMLPKGYRPIHVEVQHGYICVWAVCPFKNAEPGDATFRIVGTGQPFDSKGWEYIGTVLLVEGAIVWHVYHAVS